MGNRGNKHDDSPHLINSKLADAGAGRGLGSSAQRLFETRGDDQRDYGSGELANTLHGKDGVHHSSSPFCGRELGCDNGRQWVITTDSNTLYSLEGEFPDGKAGKTYHQNTPEDDQTNDGDGWGRGRERLGERSEDNDDQLKTIHLLTTNHIREITETQLTQDRSAGGRDLDGGI